MPTAASESTKAEAMHEAPDGIRFPTLKEKLDPRHCALLIVDVQNEFCDPDGFYAGVPEFAASKLASINRMRERSVKTAVVTGVATSGCVDSTARAAMFEDFFAVVPSDATADYVEERYRVHLAKLASGFATVTNSGEVIMAWMQ